VSSGNKEYWANQPLIFSARKVSPYDKELKIQPGTSANYNEIPQGISNAKNYVSLFVSHSQDNIILSIHITGTWETRRIFQDPKSKRRSINLPK
jgi:hypothetical protein